MSENKLFKAFLKESENTFLVDTLIIYVGKMHDNMNYHSKVKMIKMELLDRLNY